MLLVVDIGNTNINLGAYDNDRLVFVSRISTDRSKTRDQYAVELKSIFSLHNADSLSFSGSVVGSVVPELTHELCEAILMLTGTEPLTLSPGVKTGLNIRTDNPAEVGADLVAGAVGAVAAYSLPCLILDLGTATKISVLDKNGAFLGCTIAPGVSISLDALSTRTSQLPSISFKEPSHVIGTNTVDSMQSGIVFGVASMLDGMCDRIEAELNEPIGSIVATGGLSYGIVKCCKRNVTIDRNLILEGLRRIYLKNRK